MFTVRNELREKVGGRYRAPVSSVSSSRRYRSPVGSSVPINPAIALASDANCHRRQRHDTKRNYLIEFTHEQCCRMHRAHALAFCLRAAKDAALCFLSLVMIYLLITHL